MIDGASMYPDPDRRYWRRRANRRVRKARLARTALIWARNLAIQVVVAGVLLYAGYRGFRQLTTTDEFALQHIEIAGVERASRVAIEDALEPYRGRNLLDLNLHELAALARRDPWVVDAVAKRVLPDTVRVAVAERRPVAAARIDGGAYVVDATGFVVGAVGPAVPRDLPVLTGLEDLGRDDLVRTLRRGVEAIRVIGEVSPAWASGVSELAFQDIDRIVLRTVDPGPRLFLDPQRIERNLTRYLELRGEIERSAGPLDYVDLRWGGRISVKPADR